MYILLWKIFRLFSLRHCTSASGVSSFRFAVPSPNCVESYILRSLYPKGRPFHEEGIDRFATRLRTRNLYFVLTSSPRNNYIITYLYRNAITEVLIICYVFIKSSGQKACTMRMIHTLAEFSFLFAIAVIPTFTRFNIYSRETVRRLTQIRYFMGNTPSARSRAYKSNRCPLGTIIL